VVSFTLRPLYLQWKCLWYPLDRRVGGSQSRCERGSEKNSHLLLGLEPPIIQPVAQYCRTANTNVNCLRLRLWSLLETTAVGMWRKPWLWNNPGRLVAELQIAKIFGASTCPCSDLGNSIFCIYEDKDLSHTPQSFWRWIIIIIFFFASGITERRQWYSAGLDDDGFESRQGLGIFLFTTASRPAFGPTQPPIQWVTWALFLGLKRPGRETDYWPPSSAEVKNAWSYTSTPPQYAFMLWFSVKSTGTKPCIHIYTFIILK
jgi:hypothetical protein